tara:strand:+ start:219 stop:491 length:273 start_codon:yes stop_codon:yes gene_type:complete
MLLSLAIFTIIILYFIIATDHTFLIFLLLMIEPIILIKLNKNIVAKSIPKGIPFGNVINKLENNSYDYNYYDNMIYYHDNKYVIGKLINN